MSENTPQWVFDLVKAQRDLERAKRALIIAEARLATVDRDRREWEEFSMTLALSALEATEETP